MIVLNYRDSQPIYQQVKTGLRRLMVSGALLPDEKLPSVRELSGQLAINPNTIQRAYRELEAEGYIYTVSGRGSFVADYSQVDERRRAELLKQLSQAVGELRYLGLSEDELREHIRRAWIQPAAGEGMQQ